MNNSHSAIIENLERSLGARYIGDLVHGHMGATLVRLQKCQNGSLSIAKFCPRGAPRSAFADFRANLHGYAGIRKTGAENLLPPGYRVLHLRGTPVIVMDDLGENLFSRLKSEKETVPRYYRWLCAHFRETVISTLRKDEGGAYGTESLKEVSRYILWYAEKVSAIAPEINSNIHAALTEQKMTPPSSRVAICVLDFTPSNLFIFKEHATFIDPWRQKTYLGNPAVSIGQFVTLARLYRLRDAEAGATLLEDMARKNLPRILGATEDTVERGLRLGATLQYVLSAYVRRGSDPARSQELLESAHLLWK